MRSSVAIRTSQEVTDSRRPRHARSAAKGATPTPASSLLRLRQTHGNRDLGSMGLPYAAGGEYHYLRNRYGYRQI